MEGSIAAGEVFGLKWEAAKLDTGLGVVRVGMPGQSGLLSFYSIVRAGARNEVEEGVTGFAHFFEHMMFRGTPRYSGAAYNDALKDIGADTNAFTTEDYTCYHITASSSSLELIMDLESDRFQYLEYSVADFQKEARAVLGEYNKCASDPELLLEETMQDKAFKCHTYKHTTLGFLDDIKDMPNQFEYSRVFFDRWYRPQNTILLVVGDVPPLNELMKLAERYYGKWSPHDKTGKQPMPPSIPQEPQQEKEIVAELTWPTPTLSNLHIGYHMPGFDPADKDLAALDLFAALYFSKSSPLYRQLVLQEQKVESLQARSAHNRDPNLFLIAASIMEKEDMEYVQTAILTAIDEAAKQPINPDRLADVKSNKRYAFAKKLDTPDRVAGSLAYYLQLTGDVNSINSLFSLYETITPEDICQTVAKYFAPSNRNIILLSSSAKEDESEEDEEESDNDGEEAEGMGRKKASEKREAKAEDAKAAQSAHVADGSVIRTTVVKAETPLITFRVLFRIGSVHDPSDKPGLASLTASVVGEGGLANMSYDEILEKFYPMAVSIDAGTDKELTVFTATVHKDKLEEFYGIFKSMILTPGFRSEDFERLKEEHLNYISKHLLNDDEELGKWALQLALYGKSHPYGHIDEGTTKGLMALELEDVVAFYRQHYTTATAWVGLTGDVSDDFVERVKADFAAALPHAGTALQVALPEPPSVEQLEVTFVDKPSAIATAISLGFPLPITRSDDDFYPLYLANSFLGEHRTFNGKLMNNMREKRGLNYGDYSYIENFIQDGSTTFPTPNIPRHQQYFSIWLRPVPHDKALFALRQAIYELSLTVEKGLTAQEFEDTRRFLLHYSSLHVQSLSRQLGYAMDGAFHERQSLRDELQARLPSLTLDDVNRVIKKYWQSSNMKVVIITNDVEGMQKKLLSGEPTPLIYDTEGTPEDILAEDQIIQAYPLLVNSTRLVVVPVDVITRE